MGYKILEINQFTYGNGICLICDPFIIRLLIIFWVLFTGGVSQTLPKPLTEADETTNLKSSFENRRYFSLFF